MLSNFYLKNFFFTSTSDIRELQGWHLIGPNLKKGLLAGTVIMYFDNTHRGAVWFERNGHASVHARPLCPVDISERDLQVLVRNCIGTMFADVNIDWIDEPFYTAKEVA